MKKILSVLFLLAVSSIAYSYKNIPVQYLNLPYGVSPDEANKILVDTKFISAAAPVLDGTIYSHNYADPELTWYNPTTLRWYNITFTTNTADTLFKRDNIGYLAYSNHDTFKCIVINKDNIAEDNTAVPAGKNTKWVYRIFFHNNELFAVSVRYESDSEFQNYKSRNPNEKLANPGYVMPPLVFDASIQKLHDTYGGFVYRKIKTLDFLANKNYGAWLNVNANLFMSLYYIDYYKGDVNFTISYIDNFRFAAIAEKFQNRKYDPSTISGDTQAGVK